MSDETKPTSEWEHSHALTEGDVVATHDGKRYSVVDVSDDGAVTAKRLDVLRNESIQWSESETNRALVEDSIFRESDGKSHELATF